MAKLSSHALSLEIRYKNFRGGDVQYEIGFLWENESMINDALLKRWSEYWRSRNPGYFLAWEYEQDRLIKIIEKVLKTDEPAYWEPIDPDIILAIYPKKHFPFLMKSRYELMFDEEEIEQNREKLAKGKSPDDWFTVIAFVDAYNFQNSSAYLDSGIALHLLVERKDVQAFCAKLKEEYAGFREKFKVDEYKPRYEVQQ
jgi:hypothetical protein